MWRRLLLSIGICAVAVPALAADRFYCAADDTSIKFSIDSGFSDGPGHKLNHFRGLMVGKSPLIPEDFRKLPLESTQLTQYWAYAGEVRLAVAAFNGNGDNAASAELVIVASGKEDGTPMPGSYVLTISTPDGAKPAKLNGRLTCNAK